MNSRILKLFIFSQLFAFVIILCIPAKAISPNLELLFLLNIIFTSIVSIISVMIVKIYPVKYNVSKEKPMTFAQLAKITSFLSISAISGFILIFYDRIFIRGIDYSVGLRNARYQWLDSTGGSLASILGNILISFGYVGLFFLIFHYEYLSRFKKILLSVACLVSILGHAALNGGRSNILLGIIFVIISLIIKKGNQKKLLNSFDLKGIKLLFISTIIFGYIIFVTVSSAMLGDFDLQTLTNLGIDSLYGQVDEWFYDIEKIDKNLYLIVYFLAYLYHGQWTTQVAFTLTNKFGEYTFYPFKVILYKLDLISQPLEQGYFAETGAFMALPGAFYYDFGFLGVIILSLVLGVLFGVAMIILNYNKNISGVKLAYIFYIFFILILSPIVPAYGFMYLNFIILSFLLLEISILFFYKKNINWLKISCNDKKV